MSSSEARSKVTVRQPVSLAIASSASCERPAAARQPGGEAGDEITEVMVPNSRPSRYWFVLPALLLFGLVFWVQRRRKAAGLSVGTTP
ncbi:MAG: DUF3394 domain-containing protein [Mesorhizobium sp.]|nr:MAG: DUF3394 domain-containing protein [Mesorhizobium sp.]